MKTKLFAAFLLVVFTLTAQENVPVRLPKFHVGVQAGATGSNVVVDWNNLKEVPQQKWGYQVGLATKYEALEWMDLNAYLDFVQKGFVIPDRLPSQEDIIQKVDAFGNMFQFSFDAQFFPFEDFGINIGPYLSYWQLGKALVETSGENIDPETVEYVVKGATGDIDLENLPQDVLLINPWDFGITGGLSYSLGKVDLKVKYEVGLSDLNQMATALKERGLLKFDGEGSDAALPPTKFRTLSVGLTYWIK
ncbi:MAG: outer membrane beta-barrel protein [Chlorobi bacterium]|nr:outer membrane beta-barrel protein [Chlorobiota bacterium]